jgi:hypothetical protein
MMAWRWRQQLEISSTWPWALRTSAAVFSCASVL